MALPNLGFKTTFNNFVERMKEDVRVLSDRLDLLARRDAMSLPINHPKRAKNSHNAFRFPQGRSEAGGASASARS